MDPIFQVLQADHLRLRRQLNSLIDQAVEEFSPGFREFAQALKAQTRAEEREIFPLLMGIPAVVGLLNELADQHHQLEQGLELLDSREVDWPEGLHWMDQVLLFKQKLDFHFAEEECVVDLALDLAPGLLHRDRCVLIAESYRLHLQELSSHHRAS